MEEVLGNNGNNHGASIIYLLYNICVNTYIKENRRYRY